MKRKSDYNTNPFTYAPNHKNDFVKTNNDDVTDLVSCDGDEDNNEELDNVVQGNMTCNPLQVMTSVTGQGFEILKNCKYQTKSKRRIMKKQTQSKLAPFWSKLPYGSKIHGLGTYKPPPVVMTDNSTNYSFGDSCVVNLGTGNNVSNVAAKRFGPPS